MDTSKLYEQRKISATIRDEIQLVFRTRGGYSGLENWIKNYQGPYPLATRAVIKRIGEDNRDPANRHYDLSDRELDELLETFILLDLSRQQLSSR